MLEWYAIWYGENYHVAAVVVLYGIAAYTIGYICGYISCRNRGMEKEA